MTTVAQIGASAFDAVAASITDAIIAVTVTRTTQGAYDVASGSYATTSTTQTGRAVVDTVKPVTDIFPAYIVGPKDQLFFIEGITALAEADTITTASGTYKVAKVQDVLHNGTLFYAVAQVLPS